MRVCWLIFAIIFIFVFGFCYGEELGVDGGGDLGVKGQLISGLDQLEGLMLGMEASILGLQTDVGVAQQAVVDMHNIAYAQGVYMDKLRGQVDELDSLDRAKSRYIVLLQSRQRKYRVLLAVGVPAGLCVGVLGGVLVSGLVSRK